ncbi:MAG: membrane protein insertase YidC, partial [Pseudomonadota bacterium]|nr:membrane protein insertase YidC [Pseudomonadota bacterium]
VNYAQTSAGFLPGLPTNRPQLVSQVRGEIDWQDLEEFCGEEQEMVQRSRNTVEMFGFDRHYFISAMLIEDLRTATFRTMRLSSAADSCLVRMAASQRQGLVAPQEEVVLTARLYFGPKVLEKLEGFDARLGETLDLGWFGSISLLLLRIIKWLYLYVGNYGLAIIILTIFIKILFYPLTHQSAVSMHKLKTLQPQMSELRARYKDNPREQQMKLMEFMRQHKVNPMKGCLPFLPQIPVFFAFYRVLSASVELRHAPFYGWITDLSAKDPYYIAPILMGVSIYLQQRLTPMTGMDKNQQRIMMFMPIIFSVMMLSMPAGVVIYVLAQTIISVAQQQWITRRLAAASSKPSKSSNKPKGDKR